LGREIWKEELGGGLGGRWNGAGMGVNVLASALDILVCYGADYEVA